MIGSESLTEANYLYYAFGLAQELASTLEPAGFSHAELQWYQIAHYTIYASNHQLNNY